MLSGRLVVAAVAALAGRVFAWDGYPDDLNERLGAYIAPGPNDSRGPCPGLNTLANHGLINRNGSNINSNDILNAFEQGFGINQNGFFTALHNFEVICEYVKGLTCGTPANDGTFILTNLTILGEPHLFEHDVSYSRQDYKENYANGGITDNIYFNLTEFSAGISFTGYNNTQSPPQPALLTPLDLNAIRLQRTFEQWRDDFPGWLQQSLPTNLFETGFIFGATFDRDSNGDMIGDTALVRADWWAFWFQEESFPTQLGWVPASTSFFDINFISTYSSSVLATLPASIPSPLPPGATNTTAPEPTNLPEAPSTSLSLLFQGTPYSAPTNPSSIPSETANATPTIDAQKRDAAADLPTVTVGPALSSIIASIQKHDPKIIESALHVAGPAPPKYNFYEQQLDIASVNAQLALARSYEAKVISVITSILHI